MPWLYNSSTQCAHLTYLKLRTFRNKGAAGGRRVGSRRRPTRILNHNDIGELQATEKWPSIIFHFDWIIKTEHPCRVIADFLMTLRPHNTPERRLRLGQLRLKIACMEEIAVRVKRRVGKAVRWAPTSADASKEMYTIERQNKDRQTRVSPLR